MALWDQLKSRLSDLQATTTTQVGKFKSKDFAKASMAMCALIAAADGTITADERRKTAGFIGSNDALKVFEASELQDHFTFYASKLETDYDFGKVEAIATIGKLKSKPDAARAVIQVGHHHRWRRRQLRRGREARRPRGVQRGGHRALRVRPVTDVFGRAVRAGAAGCGRSRTRNGDRGATGTPP